MYSSDSPGDQWFGKIFEDKMTPSNMVDEISRDFTALLVCVIQSEKYAQAKSMSTNSKPEVSSGGFDT